MTSIICRTKCLNPFTYNNFDRVNKIVQVNTFFDFWYGIISIEIFELNVFYMILPGGLSLGQYGKLKIKLYLFWEIFVCLFVIITKADGSWYWIQNEKVIRLVLDERMTRNSSRIQFRVPGGMYKTVGAHQSQSVVAFFSSLLINSHILAYVTFHGHFLQLKQNKKMSN